MIDSVAQKNIETLIITKTLEVGLSEHEGKLQAERIIKAITNPVPTQMDKMLSDMLDILLMGKGAISITEAITSVGLSIAPHLRNRVNVEKRQELDKIIASLQYA
ncbi:hypothetical protein F0267_01710 [Vibrio coralliilyticus]|uniref:Uncharacterized protein n=1 Tax=Vibrio coralliilyticus TaxID=190893 RepID=A0AAN0W154_9VIBR|nr:MULTISPECIES: hypothetical protein [Vibrio]AIW22386.1 hypothetical protein IX92_25280 [Vibrio coralliilyticus]MCZ2799040.1 hypothetical protein [Vibrio alginolyticus]NOH36940.1 hypothetical protein [Vibrio coralliilyticus]